MRDSTPALLLLATLSPMTLAAQAPAPKKPATQTQTKTKTAHAPSQPRATPVTTPSGLQYVDLVVGAGPSPKEGDTVVVHYTGRFANGKVFDSSVGKAPFEFVLGRGRVIKGWDEGVASMRVGGRRKLTIPPDLAYGAKGYPGAIPPNSTLVFVVRLLKIK
jgi:peptidylprolyl isomerase